MKIKMSIRQRLHSMGLIRQQRKEVDNVDSLSALRVMRRLLDKIRVPDAEVSKFLMTIPGVGDVNNVAALNRSDEEEPLEVDLEEAEAAKLKLVLTVGFRASVDDFDWWDGLVTQLKDVK